MAADRSRGFSLIEMIATLAILVILATIAIPSFNKMIRNNRVAAANRALLADLNYARFEATSRGRFVAICPSTTDGAACLTSGTSYELGWLVYAASRVDQTYAADATTPLLRYTAKRQGVAISATNGKVITFDSSGRLAGQQFQLAQGDSSTVGVPPTFITCASAGDGSGQSTAAVPGIKLQLLGFGSPVSAPLTASASCTP